MELKEVRAFVAVATELNFSRAAERLNSSQAPLTRLIQKLENSLGVALFERTTRQVKLTPAGERFLEEAVPLLAHADRVACTVRHDVADRTRALRIGCTALAFHTILPPVLADFQTRHQDVEVDVQERASARLLAALNTAELDLALLLLPQSSPGLSIESLFKQRMRLAVSRSHRFATMAEAPLSAFSTDRFVMHAKAEAPAMYDEIVRCCTMAGFRPRLIENSSSSSCTGLVTANVGVHFVAVASRCLSPADVAVIDIEDPAPTLELGAAWRADDPSPLVSDLAQRCREAAAGWKRMGLKSVG